MTQTKKEKKASKVTVKVTDAATLEAEGCGGIIGVGRGSANPPRLVQLTYKPRGAKTHLALVGKGITYDSGGLSIKPGPSMMTMKCDMAGAAAVVAATFAIAELGLPIAVTTFAPMAENMVSGSATRPGDVLTMYGGKTVEVLNTDAEGRLILADALVKATENEPDVIVDVATLTGHCVVALGDRVAGLLGNDDELVHTVLAAGARVGEALWPLPIPEEMREKVRTNTKVADLAQHNTERWGGALYAAAFLREFVGDTRGRTSTSRGRRSTATARTGTPRPVARACPWRRWWSWRGSCPRRSDERLSPPEPVAGPCGVAPSEVRRGAAQLPASFCRRLYSRIRASRPPRRRTTGRRACSRRSGPTRPRERDAASTPRRARRASA